MRKKIKDIAQWLNIDIEELEGYGENLVTGVSIDTRTLKEGDLFIPFRGEKTNGHKFVQQAFEKGASCSLWLKDEPNPPKNVPLLFVEDSETALQQMARMYREELKATFIGITGSNGKTSSKDILASLLSPYYKVQKTIGNFNNELGLPLTILSLDEDTEMAVLEMGMSGFGEIEFLSTLAKPHYAIITNIGEAHMQELGSREGIAKAKFEIIKGLDPEGVLFYDGDEPLLRALVEKTPKLKSKAFGFQSGNDLRICEIETTEKGSRFMVEGDLNGEFFIPILGKHQVKNASGAMLVAKSIGLSDEQIRKGLEQVSLTNMRMQLVPLGDILFINDAYNAAPTSMKAAIEFLQSTSMRNDKWLVLGDMLELGEKERQFHEELADYIDGEKISRVCLFGPRMEWLYHRLSPRFSGRLLYTKDDYGKIVDYIKQYATKDTLILLKGSRGMKLETIINDLQ
ncbi:UDP-N-acetylmuramoyl-tripeptide--D-alanyl-D-alanine ligase [Ureibacillus terrenus]|uniref:UDP-N-acetylmuramoyl-tripeptide--D-alanyl-D-alanine ligase n=1 Tax=Ureibacillus terrenus TaxID=118246 RepID=A0A540V0X9_9BACL|nr:UDP-N-acetylmuramoyl-tripeptide--D-alanyl-D-alanine ligase [Ureibacillus terrenus]MED3662266.1 UDP-N-acetylmuramoyl-tripeptide--D-alanyl-D-alanine ligase [Ureibacillus terrenus]MED3764041.1 UDP-N-acetylmuramoyl-tripeptide--D-alanyl-D-alanine ligase [Ureibacillus terrenus]TQE90420.1 UDP-N-acetylmuramoyl-tripeptide--D-alanyl-D-alanine ligase [Ureibacillus terrenus]